MAKIHGKWLKLEQHGTSPGARSSHAIALIDHKAYVFGGEFKPRVPVDNHLHVFDLHSLTWSIADASGDVPPPRIGVTMAAVGDTIYVFGGRDAEHKELDELYAYNTRSSVWNQISGSGPPHRSYHSMTADERFVYVFGGCGVGGRLNDLAAFDTVARKWVEFPSAGEGCKGRGGPGLVVAAQKLWVVYGFAGQEMDDIHCFDPARSQWAQVETKGEKPTARSVFSSAVIGKYIFIYGGEIDPSDQGHLGAGMFSGEVYALDTEMLEWTKCCDAAGSGQHPGPRGWCAFAAGNRDGAEGLLVYGGNSPSNDRLDDIFFFTPQYDVNGKV
ncbi:unnamed protein product [Rhodiola kirilowii]